MSIVSTAYISGMACLESYHDASNRCRNNSDEIDVFAATRYFSGYTDVVLVTSNPGSSNGGVPNPYGYRTSLPDKVMRQPSSRVARESLDGSTTVAQVAVNGAIVRGDQGCVSRGKILRQPSSPGGKIVSFMKSLFNPSSSTEGNREKKVRKTTATRSLKDRDEINLGGLRRRRRSSIGHFWSSSAVADSKLLPIINGTVPSFSYVHSSSRTPPPPSNIVEERWDRSRSLSCHQQAAVSVSIRNKAREELAKWEASYAAKVARNPSNNVVDCDDDGNDSNSSSDLFELPVYDSISIESVRRSSMSTVSAGCAMMKRHV